MKKFFESISWQVVFAAFWAIFFLRNLLLPLIADDYSYAFIWDGDGRVQLSLDEHADDFVPVSVRAEVLAEIPRACW